MKYIKLIIIITLLNTAFTGCSYVSDYVEGEITNRASFSAEATYSGGTVTVTWDKTDSSDSFAGIEIYRTSDKNDEYADYELVASRYFNTHIGDNLDDGTTTSYTDTTPPSSGIYFYRVGFIHIERDDNDVLYSASNPGLYNQYTSIDAISGYAKVVIP